MNRIPISDLVEGDRVEGAYLVTTKQLAATKAGKPYLKVALRDKTGELAGRIWDRAELIGEQFVEGDVALARGLVESFNSQLQIKLDDLRRVSGADFDPADFLPASRYDIPDMWRRLQDVVTGIGNPHVRGLLQDIFAEPETAQLFQRAPAAKGIHHPWIGGLLEHVLSLCYLAKRVCPHYPHVDEDQVLYGCIMHDFAKIWELSYDGTFGYTDEGKLVGHLVSGVIVTDRHVRARPDFPKDLEMRLKHILLAHHGTYEFGSPKLPQTLEAELVHRLDDLDSKINAITETMNRRPELGAWSEYNPAMGRSFYRGEGETPAYPEELVELPKESDTAREAAPKATPRATRAKGDTGAPSPARSLDLFAGGQKE